MTALASRQWRAGVWIPAVLFVLLVAVLAIGLTLNPREVPSPLIGKPAPQFELPLLTEPAKTFSPRDMQGKVWLLNVWASWCTTCVDEHPALSALSKSGAVPVYGLNYKDQREEGKACCNDHGATEMREYAKTKVKALGLAGEGKARINMAGCLDRCEQGPVIVVYPEEVWYTYVDQEDVDEIITEHLQNGRVVERLKI